MRWRSVFKKTSTEKDQTSVPVPSFAPSKRGGHRVSTTPRVISFERDTRDPIPPEQMREVALFDGEESIREGPSLEEAIAPILNESAGKEIPTKLPLAASSRKSKHGRFSFKGLFGKRKSWKQDDSIASSLPIQVIPESYFEDDEIYGESSLSMDLKNLLAEDESLISAMMELQPLGVVDHAKLKDSPSQSIEEEAQHDNASSLEQNDSTEDAASKPGESPQSRRIEAELFQGWSPFDTLSSWFETLETIKMGNLSGKETEMVKLPEIDQTVLDDVFSWIESSSSLTIEQFEQINDWLKANSMEPRFVATTEAPDHSSKLNSSTPETKRSGGIIEDFRDQNTDPPPTSMTKKKWKWYSSNSPHCDAASCADSQSVPQREGDPAEEDYSAVKEECRDSLDQDDGESQRLGSVEEENLLGNSVSEDNTTGESVSMESTGGSGVWSAYNSPGGQLIDPFSPNMKHKNNDEEARVEAAIRVFRKHAEILGVNERDLLMAVQQSYHDPKNRSVDDFSESRDSHHDVIRSEYGSVAGSVGMDSTIESMESIDSIDTMEMTGHKQTSMRQKKTKVGENSGLSVSSQKSWRSVKTM